MRPRVTVRIVGAAVLSGLLGLAVLVARAQEGVIPIWPCTAPGSEKWTQKDYYQMQASLFGYVETDYPLAPQEQAEAHEKKTAEIDAKIAPLRQRVRQIDEPYRTKLAQEKYKKYPANVQQAIAVPEEKRTPGEALLAGQVIRTTSVSSDDIDRVMSPADL